MAHKAEHRIWKVLMKATSEGTVPDGYYGPETCRWATPQEMRRFGLTDCPLVHLDQTDQIDSYFTEIAAVVVNAH